MARIKGIQDALRDMQQLTAKVNRAKKVAELRIAERMAADARSLAPEDKGLLIAGIGTKQSETSTSVVSEAEYSAYQEFGTGPLVQIPQDLKPYAAEFIINKEGNTPPQPFFFTAIFKHKEELIPEVEKELQKLNK
jgi:HK97 gp10 family phage protein